MSDTVRSRGMRGAAPHALPYWCGTAVHPLFSVFSSTDAGPAVLLGLVRSHFRLLLVKAMGVPVARVTRATPAPSPWVDRLPGPHETSPSASPKQEWRCVVIDFQAVFTKGLPTATHRRRAIGASECVKTA